jgi:ABC-2 type transport system permease protein
MSVAAAPPRASWAEPPGPVRTLAARTAALSLVELQKLRHDHTELLTRTIQPLLWLLVFGQVFGRLRAIPTGDVPYLAYLTPGILAQSALFVAIFFGIQIIWDRDAGIELGAGELGAEERKGMREVRRSRATARKLG